jgi:ACT domain-containing protein
MKEAIICCNGKLTKNYKYIMQLRKLNELQKKEEQEEKEIEQKKPKGLKRSISFTSLCISGHIFDTKFFNDTLDILESAKANFRILNMNCGQREDEESSATLQIFSHDVMRLNNAIDRLYEAAQDQPVKISKQYEKELKEKEE